MTYRFKLQEPIAAAVGRVGLAQIEMAEGKLAGNGDVATAIHDARRCIKRLRALLRLIRPGLSDKSFEAEEERLASVGHLLSGVRDAHVMQQTLLKLEARFGPLPDGAGERLRAAAEKSSSDPKPNARGDFRRGALQRLKLARKLFKPEGLAGVEFDSVGEGLESSYRKARKAFRNAYRHPSNETFHAWRKGVQRHWRHMQLLSRAWPETLSARASEAKAVSQLLGEDHDLAVLMAFAETHAGTVLTAEAAALLGAQCVSCQTELRDLAKPRGERLFAEPAEDLKQRLLLYWSCARQLSDAAAESDAKPNGKAKAKKAPRPKTRARAVRARPAKPGPAPEKSERRVRRPDQRRRLSWACVAAVARPSTLVCGPGPRHKGGEN